jgi:hypothetical protein
MLFDDLFAGGATRAVANPQVALGGFKFRLLTVEPVRPWKDTGKKDERGKVIREPDKNAYDVDETGERIKLAVGLQLIDASGRATSPKAPHREQTHYFTHDEAASLVACAQAGGFVELKSARIEFVDSTRDGFVTSVPRLMFDEITPTGEV